MRCFGFVLTAALMVIGGCGMMRSTATDTIIDSVPIPPADTLKVRSFNGSIKVSPGPDDTVSWIAKRSARGTSEAAATANLDSLRVVTSIEDDQFVLGFEKPDQFRGGLSFEVMVPSTWMVDAQTSNGAIETEVFAPVKLRTSNGRIRIDNAASNVEARTSNGSIRLSTSSDVRLELETSNGSVTVDAPVAVGDNDVSTRNGRLTFDLRNHPVDVQADTSNGKVRLGDQSFGTSGRATLGSALWGTTGDASALVNVDRNLDCHTSNGSITVRFVESDPLPTDGFIQLDEVVTD